MEKRKLLAQMSFCRGLLYYFDMITDRENERIHKRILKWQEKNNVKISSSQIDSVDITYNDTPES